MRNHVLVLVALIGLGAAGCGGGESKDAPASPTAAAKPAAGTGPLPTVSPKPQSDTGLCTTVTYRLTAAGAEVDTRVVATPAKINVEADDADDNPITGDPRTSGATYVFKGPDTRHVIVIKGVRKLDHVTVIALGTARDDSCQAVRR